MGFGRSWMNIQATGVVLYGSNIIKDLNYPNFFEEKFGGFKVSFILYP
jgi:hypothetical protein